MSGFTAKDVQALRQATGAGMMDAKKALEANDGDFEVAAKWLRERGLGKAAERTDRVNAEGAIAVAQTDGAIALQKNETAAHSMKDEDEASTAKEAVEAEILAQPESSLAGIALKLRVLAWWMDADNARCAIEPTTSSASCRRSTDKETSSATESRRATQSSCSTSRFIRATSSLSAET